MSNLRLFSSELTKAANAQGLRNWRQRRGPLQVPRAIVRNTSHPPALRSVFSVMSSRRVPTNDSDFLIYRLEPLRVDTAHAAYALS
jgi:hypothetical protein